MGYIFVPDGGPEAEEFDSNYIPFDPGIAGSYEDALQRASRLLHDRGLVGSATLTVVGGGRGGAGARPRQRSSRVSPAATSLARSLDESLETRHPVVGALRTVARAVSTRS